MQNYSKKKITLASLLIFATPVAVITPAASLQAMDTQITSESIAANIDERLCLMQGYGLELAEIMQAFVSPADKRPYADHVEAFAQCYLAAKKDVVVPMESLLASIDTNNPDYKVVFQTHAALHKMVEIMDYIQKSLHTYKGTTNPAALGKKLISMKTTARERLQHVFVALTVLTETMKNTPGYAELAIKATALQVELKEVLKDDGNMSFAQQFKMLGVLKQRCK